MNRPSTKYKGVLFIGDPHLEGRVPGFRKDDYPRVVLDKLDFCLRYAKRESLLPAILGDLFHRPRDNPNWMLVELIQMFDREILAIYGNHDVHENTMNAHDSLNILVESGRLRLLDRNSTYRAEIAGHNVMIGGTSWKQPIPKSFDRSAAGADFVFWMTHHDIAMPGYEIPGHLPAATEIPGIDVVVNGHIHRRLDRLDTGTTTWLTPGNISRRKRCDAVQQHVPAALRIDFDNNGWKESFVEVPHQPFDMVFHETVTDPSTSHDPTSAFVAGLAELQLRKTDTAAGLFDFLEKNLDKFDPDVATEINNLAKEITSNV